jgi:hypothetical protein
MAPFFRWHGHEGHWHPHEGRRHWDRWQGREEPGPGPSRGPDVLQSVVSAATAPITAPLKAIGGLFGLEVEDPFPVSDEEAEMYPTRHRRPRSARYPSGDENSESGDEFAPWGEQMPQLTNPRTRWPWFQRGEQVWQDDARRALEFEASPPEPRFLVECPAGCPPVVAGRCITVVRQAIIEAIKMANDAANKLEAATNLEISKRDKVKDKDAIETAGFFRSIFGHDPTRKVPWDDNKASGISVAKRFRAVANELGGGRRIVFRCVLDARANCAANDLTCCLPDDRAWTLQPLVPNVVHLCPPFWNPPAGLRGLPPENFRGGTIIHEMLHVLYWDFFHHVPTSLGVPGERRRNNAHCFKAFALLVNGYGRDPAATAGCGIRLF